jgi:aryl carrier-like protein
MQGVTDAIVLALEDSAGDKKLVAYYTGADAPSAEALRSEAKVRLPDYMVPVAYVHLPAWPLNTNGKVDRRALPAPERAAYSLPDYEPPHGELEETLAKIWQEVLKVERVGRNDNFFELGGHSLMALTLVERMRSVGLQADVRALFLTPTLRALAEAVDEIEEMIL